MVEKPLKFNVPLYPYCNQTVYGDPILAMYATKEYNNLTIIAKKRYKKDQETPYYIGMNFDPILGQIEGGVYGFVTFDDARHELMDMVHGDDVFDTIFDFHRFEETWQFFSDVRFERYWWYARSENKVPGNDYPPFNENRFLFPFPPAQTHPARQQPGWRGY